jgi:hypothetical protein
MPRRHHILYDVVRWRRNRTWLLFPAMVCLLVTVFGSAIRSDGGSTQLYSLAGAFLFALALTLWTRQRFSYLAVEGEDLVVRVAMARYRLPLSQVRRARVARLASKFSRADRSRLLPRPRQQWLEREAVVARLDSDAAELIKLRRLLGARCLDGNDLVVPVADPAGLVADIEEHRPTAPAAATAPRRPRRKR